MSQDEWSGFEEPQTPESAIGSIMLNMRSDLQPVFEAGIGMKVDFERQGWTPIVAEQLAAQFVAQNMSMLVQQIWIQGSQTGAHK